MRFEDIQRKSDVALQYFDFYWTSYRCQESLHLVHVMNCYKRALELTGQSCSGMLLLVAEVYYVIKEADDQGSYFLETGMDRIRQILKEEHGIVWI